MLFGFRGVGSVGGYIGYAAPNVYGIHGDFAPPPCN